MALDNKFYKAYVRRGIVLHQRGRYLQAIKDFQFVLDSLQEDEAQGVKPKVSSEGIDRSAVTKLLAKSTAKFEDTEGCSVSAAAGKSSAATDTAPAQQQQRPQVFTRVSIAQDCDDDDDDDDESSYDEQAHGSSSTNSMPAPPTRITIEELSD